MQGILNLGNNNHHKTNDFVVSHSNFEAYNIILNWKRWQNKRLLIIGPPKSGKTSLARIWQKNTEAIFLNANAIDTENIKHNKAIIIDNIEHFRESGLINLINFANEKSLSLLLTSTKYPSFSLKDLNSRIRATYQAIIKEPDEQLLKLLIVRLFAQRQIKVSEKIVNFIFSNIERNYESAYRVVKLVDETSKTEKRNVTTLFVRKVLAEYYKA